MLPFSEKVFLFSLYFFSRLMIPLFSSFFRFLPSLCLLLEAEFASFSLP